MNSHITKDFLLIFNYDKQFFLLQEHVYPRLDIEYSAKSIFAETTINDARNPATFHVINNASTSMFTQVSNISYIYKMTMFLIIVSKSVNVDLKVPNLIAFYSQTWLLDPGVI